MKEQGAHTVCYVIVVIVVHVPIMLSRLVVRVDSLVAELSVIDHGSRLACNAMSTRCSSRHIVKSSQRLGIGDTMLLGRRASEREELVRDGYETWDDRALNINLRMAWTRLDALSRIVQ